ncbi:MAG: 2-oxo acid dehydrogenase subunit E2 [Spirochaetaceae bacterium]
MNQAMRVETFPVSRVGTFDVGVIGGRKHQIVGLLEADVTAARRRLRALRREGAGGSFTALVVKTVADTVKEMPQVHGVRLGRRRRVVFEDVDVAVIVERVVEGVSVPLPVVVRKCNEKSVEEIEAEIRRAATQAIDGTGDYELGRKRSGGLTRLFYHLPQFLRLAIMGSLLRSPKARKEAMGTVIVTSIASDIRFPGWIIPRTMHNLAVGLGSVVRKPWVVGDSVVPREILNLTVLLDHDVVDGAPAARFGSRLIENLEKGVVLKVSTSLLTRPD